MVGSTHLQSVHVACLGCSQQCSLPTACGLTQQELTACITTLLAGQQAQHRLHAGVHALIHACMRAGGIMRWWTVICGLRTFIATLIARTRTSVKRIYRAHHHMLHKVMNRARLILGSYRPWHVMLETYME